MRVPYVDLAGQYRAQRDELLAAVEGVLESGWYIGGDAVSRFEASFAELCGATHAVSVANGTDALIITLKALGIGPGDEVITVPNSWISSASCIALVGARPVFVDVRDDQNLDPDRLEAAITPRTRAVLPVHLTGRCADMAPIAEICERHDLELIEDAAQAVGAGYHGRRAGSLARVACFSLHPLKNLAAAGDAGVITTSDDELAASLRLLRNHGLVSRNEAVRWGFNSRLDALQAAILQTRVPLLDSIVATRRRNAQVYRAALGELVRCPSDAPGCFDVYHLFVIQTPRRDELRSFLTDRGVETAIHYPKPIHLQPAAASLGYGVGSFPVVERQAGEILSLPVHQGLREAQARFVADSVVAFFS